MSEIRIPAGESLRMVAERLGVPVEQLQAHTDIRDVEAPQAIPKHIEVPDGFLRERNLKKSRAEARHVPRELKPGMNMWLALDIEQKRTRAAGGLHGHGSTEDESLGLSEARRAYLRFESLSNELAIDLYRQLTASRSIDVRAVAFAGMAVAQAQQHRLFGAPLDKVRSQALSSAKAALLADPKLGEAHLGYGLALDLGEGEGSDEAMAELERAVGLAPEDPWAKAALASLLRRRGDPERAQSAATAALDAEKHCPFALETLARIAEDDGAPQLALQIWERAVDALDTYANAHLGLALLLRRLGRPQQAAEQLELACAVADGEAHRAWLTECFEGDRQPYV